MPRRKAPRRLRVLDWNVGASRQGDDVMRCLRALADVAKPHVICLHEAWRYDSAILLALPDYQLHEAEGGFKADDNIILTRRKKAPAGRLAFLRMRLRWTGPKSPRKFNQPPRIWPVLDIGLRKWRIVSFHAATANNPEARAEGFDALVDLAEQRGSRRRGLLIVGDFNGNPAGLARKIGAEVTEGDHPDYLVARGATVKVRSLGRYGSDHEAHVYTCTRT